MFKKELALAVVSFSALFMLAGCATNPIAQALSPGMDTMPVQIAPITMIVPNDPGILNRDRPGLVRDIRLDELNRSVMPNAMYVRILNQDNTGTAFTVHARTDNGIAGSGVKYRVQYGVAENKDGYSVAFRPTERSTYQQGLVGKFPLPDFGDRELLSHLTSFSIHYKFEIDSSFNTESVYANFARLATPRQFVRGETDPVTGKIYKNWYVINYKGRQVRYIVETYPYRNGSKCVVFIALPAVETGNNVVDFRQIITDLRKSLAAIANA